MLFSVNANFTVPSIPRNDKATAAEVRLIALHGACRAALVEEAVIRSKDVSTPLFPMTHTSIRTYLSCGWCFVVGVGIVVDAASLLSKICTEMDRHRHGNFWDKIQPRRNGWYNLVINRNYLTSHRIVFCESVFILSKGQTNIRFSLSILSLIVKFLVFIGNNDTAHFFLS